MFDTFKDHARCWTLIEIECSSLVAISVSGMLEKAVFFAEYENINNTGVSGMYIDFFSYFENGSIHI